MPQSLHNGRYRLLRKIGDPALNEIYLGKDLQLDRQVVVKLIRTRKKTFLNRVFKNQDQTQALDKLKIDKFNIEARIAAHFQDDHIVEVYDRGTEKRGKYILNYIVMRYYQVGSLEQWFKARGNPLSAREVAELLAQAGAAVQYTHNQRYVHRDIKPTNFLVKSTQDSSALPTLVLADFGHALLGGEDTVQDSKGTSYYMAPERWGKGRVIFATDQYALAIMAYYLLTGQHPFEGAKDVVRKKHMHDPPPALRHYGISPAVEKVVFKALEKKPEDRYPSVTAFTEAFSAACGGLEPVPGDDKKPKSTRKLSSNTETGPGCLSLPGQIFKSIKTGRPKWARPVALMAALSIIAIIVALVAPLWTTQPRVSVTPSCSTNNPFPTIDSSSYPLPTTQTVRDSSSCEQIGLSVGTRFFDIATDTTNIQAQKTSIANEIASGKLQEAQPAFERLIDDNPNDAEARIYQEDQKNLLQNRRSYIAVVLGLDFSSPLLGGTRDALQAAYIAQKQWDDAATSDQPQLLLIVANTGDDSAPDNIKNVVSQIIDQQHKDSKLIGIVGWEDSTRTLQAIQVLKDHSIPLISPSASDKNLSS